MPGPIDTLGGSTNGWLPYSFFVVLGLSLVALFGTTYLVWGRWLYAVGGNPDAARRIGIPVGRVLVTVYALSGLAAGVGGSSPPDSSMRARQPRATSRSSTRSQR